MGDESDDPEERRRKMEAKISAENMGMAIGLIAGAALAVDHHNKMKEADAPERAASVQEQSMG